MIHPCDRQTDGRTGDAGSNTHYNIIMLSRAFVDGVYFITLR